MDLQEEAADVLCAADPVPTRSTRRATSASRRSGWRDYLADAGLESSSPARRDERPNLVARLPRRRRRRPGARLPLARRHRARRPGRLVARPVGRRGRRRLRVGPRRARHEVARSPPRWSPPRRSRASGWRPARGELKVFCVVDEETGGEQGAQWLTEQRPDLARCDYLLNEGGGAVMPYGDRRLYGVCVAEKGTFRFTPDRPRRAPATRRCRRSATTRCSSSLPAIERLGAGARRPSTSPTRRARCSRRSARTRPTRRARVARIARREPRLAAARRADAAASPSPRR